MCCGNPNPPGLGYHIQATCRIDCLYQSIVIFASELLIGQAFVRGFFHSTLRNRRVGHWRNLRSSFVWLGQYIFRQSGTLFCPGPCSRAMQPCINFISDLCVHPWI